MSSTARNRLRAHASRRDPGSPSSPLTSSEDDFAKEAREEAACYVEDRKERLSGKPPKKKKKKKKRDIASADENGEAREALRRALDPTGKELKLEDAHLICARSAHLRSKARPHTGSRSLAPKDHDEDEDDNDNDDGGDSASESSREPSRAHGTFDTIRRHPPSPNPSPLHPVPSSEEEESEVDLLAPRTARSAAKAWIERTQTSDEEEEEELNLRKTTSRKLPTGSSSVKLETSAGSEGSRDNGMATTVTHDESEEEEEIRLSSRSLKKEDGLINGQSRASASTSHRTTTLLEVDPRPPFAASPEQAQTGSLPLDPEDSVRVPASINRFLREYQRDGIRFLFKAWKEQRGAILGDDMGLGKTVQVIGFLAAIMGKTGGAQDLDRRIRASRARRISKGAKANATWPTCLVLCPQSVTGNWIKELETWGYFETAQYGSGLSDPLPDFRKGRLDIIVASHEYAILRIEELRDLDWSVIFVDEAHKFKSPTAKGTKAMNRFQCPVRFAMSGTVIQNRYEEMWALFDWTNPGKFGSPKVWKDLIALPLRRGQQSGASVEDIASGRLVSKLFTENLLPSVLLRRTKALIADQMPLKIDKIVFCPLAPEQLHGYRHLCKQPEVDMILQMEDPCDCGARAPDGLPYQKRYCCYVEAVKESIRYAFTIMYLMTCLSNHAALFFPDAVDLRSPKKQVRRRYGQQLEYVKRLWPDSWQSKRCDQSNGLRPDLCGKWLVLRGLLTTWQKQGDKVLLFSRSLRLLNWLQWFVEHSAWPFLRLDGSTAQSQRQQKVDEFNRDPSVFLFLISTRAGGTGLNLTGANKVVIFDPSWNPAEDMQAMDRAYRFGQQRDVHVYRLIGAGTLEEIIYSRQIYKSQAANIAYSASPQRRFFTGVEGVKDQQGELFGLKNMFSLREASLITKAIIEDCEIQETADEMRQFLLEWKRDSTRSGVATDWDLLEEEGEGEDDEGGGGDGGEEDEAGQPETSSAHRTSKSKEKALSTLPQKKKRKQTQRNLFSAEALEEEEYILAANGVQYVHDHQRVMRGGFPDTNTSTSTSTSTGTGTGTGTGTDTGSGEKDPTNLQSRSQSTSSSSKSMRDQKTLRPTWPPPRNRNRNRTRELT